jgi:hypothetical protein
MAVGDTRNTKDGRARGEGRKELGTELRQRHTASSFPRRFYYTLDILLPTQITRYIQDGFPTLDRTCSCSMSCPRDMYGSEHVHQPFHCFL